MKFTGTNNIDNSATVIDYGHFYRVYLSFYNKLVKVLPSSDALFRASLRTKGLLPGDLYDQVCRMSETRSNADTNVFFLRNSIERYLEIDDIDNFTKLLQAMEEYSDDNNIKKLIEEIERYLNGISTIPQDYQIRKTGMLLYS